MKKYNNYLFFIGVFLLTIGVVGGKIAGNWSSWSLGLIFAGITVIITTALIFLYFNQGFWSMRSTTAATNALISTVAVIVILGLINFLAVKYSYRQDFTETKLYTLSPQSQQLVKNLAQPLTVYVFDSQPNSIDRTLLENYARYNSKFKYEFVDPQVKIGLAEKFDVERVGAIYLEYIDKKQFVQSISPATRLSEVKLTNAIAKIQRTEQPIIYILQGHGEPSLGEGAVSFSQAVTNLQEKGYLVNPLNLATSPLVPPDASVLIVSNGERGLLEGEVKALKQYVERGGSLFVMYNADTPVKINSILAEWGVTFDDGLVVDASGTGEIFGLGPSVTLVVNYGSHPITQDFGNSISVFPWARAIITKPVENITATALLITNPQTWAESNTDAEEVQLDPNEDLAGPLDIGVALVRKNPQAQSAETERDNSPPNAPAKPEDINTPISQPESKTALPNPPKPQTPDSQSLTSGKAKTIPAETKMVVVGNSNFATNGWFQQQLNGDVFLNAIAWLANQDSETLSISPKQPTNRRLNLTVWQAGLIGWLALLIIPGLGLITATVTWWRRSR
jgi:ABC-type uncharacterized transport system involved in gliding motility auxiliary subunit